MKSSNKSLIVLGIDPGFGTTGYGLVSNEGGSIRSLAWGAIKTEPKKIFALRLLELGEDIERLAKKYRPTVAVVEKLFFARNVTTAIDVGQARGVALAALAKMKIPIYELTPLQVKLAVTGYGRADKQQVQEMVMKLLSLRSIPKPDDAADALAIAIAGAGSLALWLKTSKK